MSTHTSTAAGPVPRPIVSSLPRYSRAAGLDSVRWVGSSNESCIAPSPLAVSAMAEAASRANRYPGITGERLSGAIAETLGLDAGQVVVGGGSLALLGHILSAYAPQGSSVVHAWRSYEAYPILIALAGAEAVPVDLDAEHRHDLAAMGAAITVDTRVVLVCNPNNPTGTVLREGELEAFLQRVPSHVLVVLDEAYREFSSPETEPALLLQRYPNLVVLRTFSKAYGLAGARAGYLMAGPGVAASIRAVAPPFGLSSLAEAGALAAWDDAGYLESSVSEVVAEREYLRAGLLERGLQVPPSGGNFLWIAAGARSLDLETVCVGHGVSVRAFAGSGVRVTVSVREASDAVLRAIDSLSPPLPGAPIISTAAWVANKDQNTGDAS